MKGQMQRLDKPKSCGVGEPHGPRTGLVHLRVRSHRSRSERSGDVPLCSRESQDRRLARLMNRILDLERRLIQLYSQAPLFEERG